MILFFRQWQSQDFGAWRDHLKNNSFFWRDKEDSIDNCSPKRAWTGNERVRIEGARVGEVTNWNSRGKIEACYCLKPSLTNPLSKSGLNLVERENVKFYRASNTFPRTNSILKWHTFSSLNQIQIIKLSQLLSKLFYFNSECVSIVNEEGREVSKV